MKTFLGVVFLSLFLVGCSKSQKEEVQKVADDMTGVTTVRTGQRAVDAIDSITTVDNNRVNDAMSVGEEE